MLFIANHEQLLNPKDAREATHNSEKPSPKDELDKYVLTLQAIGNAIIVQVDELVRRRAYQKGLDARAETEFKALQRIANPSAFEVIFETRKKLKDMLEKTEKALQALDDQKAERSSDEVKQLEDRKKLVTDAIEEVKSVTGDTLSKIYQAKVSLGPAAVFVLLRFEIAKRAAFRHT